MLLSHVQALLDSCFHGVKEGADRMHEPADPRFTSRVSAVWLEYRWYIHERGLAEVFIKWKRVEPRLSADTAVSVLRLHLLGHSPTLAACARRVLEAGTPSPERLLDLFGEDGVRRECTSSGPTTITVEHWPHPTPTALMPEERFQAFASVLLDPTSSTESRHHAVDRLCAAERSPRVVETLLAALDKAPSLSALRRLSEWGELGALPHLEQAIAQVPADNAGDLWALTALQRRLHAWQAMTRAAAA
jgi:hypothetical protein